MNASNKDAPTPAVCPACATDRPQQSPGRRVGRWLRRTLVVVLTASLLLGVGAYFARDKIIEAVIRHRMTSAQPDPSYLKDDGHIRVLTCGTGTPELSGAAQACTLVAVGGRMFLFDAGDGATESLIKSRVDLSRIDRVFVTHFHSDHFNGLGTLVNQRWAWGAARSLPVVGPPGVRRVVNDLNDAYGLDIGYRTDDMPALAKSAAAATATPVPVKIPTGQTSTRAYDSHGVTIDAVRVQHAPVEPAYGYVLRYQDKKIFISGDTLVSEHTLPYMNDADLVVHEAYSTDLIHRAMPVLEDLGLTFDKEVAARTSHYHSDTIALAKQAQQAGVKHLVLTHLIPYPSNFLQRRMFVSGMSEEYHGKVTVAKDGDRFVL